MQSYDIGMNNKDVVIYGAGVYGKMIASVLKRNKKRIIFCDIKYSGNEEGINPRDIKKYPDCDFILGSISHMKEMYNNLIKEGINPDRIFSADNVLLASKDVNRGKAIVYGINSFKMRSGIEGRYLLNHLDCMITTKCTLKCRDCESLMPYYSNPKNYSAESIIQNIDKILDSGICIQDFVIIGGEPFINQEAMATLLKYYRNDWRINRMFIFSNATIIPKDVTIEAMKMNKKTYVWYSNYGRLSKKIDECVEILNNNDIMVYMPHQNDDSVAWFQVGRVKLYDRTNDENQRVFERCTEKDLCHTLLDGKLYRCSRIGNGTLAGMIPWDENNYLDINLLDVGEVRKEIEKMMEGKNFMPGCKYCLINQTIKVPRAEQLE